MTKAGKIQESHGMSRTLTNQAWRNMKDRCYNKNNPRSKDYMGRDIVVCERWKDSFSNFYSDMGDKPEGMSLDRINNDGPYSPENCRWAYIYEQANNTSRNIFITYKGQTKTITQWGLFLGIRPKVLHRRIRELKWPIEKALETKPWSN